MERVLDGIPLYLKGVNNKVMSARVAQSVERSAVNRKVGGSNPPVSGFLSPLPTLPPNIPSAPPLSLTLLFNKVQYHFYSLSP